MEDKLYYRLLHTANSFEPEVELAFISTDIHYTTESAHFLSYVKGEVFVEDKDVNITLGDSWKESASLRKATNPKILNGILIDLAFWLREKRRTTTFRINLNNLYQLADTFECVVPFLPQFERGILYKGEVDGTEELLGKFENCEGEWMICELEYFKPIFNK